MLQSGKAEKPCYGRMHIQGRSYTSSDVWNKTSMCIFRTILLQGHEFIIPFAKIRIYCFMYRFDELLIFKDVESMYGKFIDEV